MLRQSGYCLLVIGLIVLTLPGGMALPAAAQGGPDAWTNIDLNLRMAPNFSAEILTILPPNTPLLIEARTGDLAWLLAHTEDGVLRGWVASGYLIYREGFNAANLPISEEVMTVSGDAPAPAPVAPADPAATPVPGANPNSRANGTIEGMQLIFTTGHSEYYQITYWSDGLRVVGYLGYPTGGGPYPAIIFNRGGQKHEGALTGTELIPLVEAGYVAVASQYRGNMGGDGVDDFGGGDVRDTLNLIPLLYQFPFVDTWRIGMMGVSRGGMVTYMVLRQDYLSGHHSIKAAVTVGGITDLFMWAREQPNLVGGLMGPYSYGPFADRSATLWVNDINAPLLLVHGEADATVSVEQARLLYAALRDAGKTAELITYYGGDHALSGQGGGYPAALDWFNRFFSYQGEDRRYDTHLEAIRAAMQGYWEATH